MDAGAVRNAQSPRKDVQYRFFTITEPQAVFPVL